MKDKKSVSQKQPSIESKPFTIPYPLLWLVAACIILYFPTLDFGFTELDDSIFIRELHLYNEDISNLLTSFKRGVFDATKDTYYRPLFLDSMILNYQASEEDITGYRLVNLLLHIVSVSFLFHLFKKTGLNEITAFLLTLLFAVHPVLSQAVAWIPGRNDTLMAVFVLPFLIKSIDYGNSGKPGSLLLALLCLTAAFFTKETALLAPAVAWILQVVLLKKSWKSRNMLIQYVIWIIALIIYFAVRSQATLQEKALVPAQMFRDFIHRIPVLLQYLGKIFLPFNLSVFPIQQDTSYYFGIAALIILAGLLIAAKHRDNRRVFSGISLFIIFLVPVLFVPNNLNEQTFEHRLYLPVIGILMLLPETILFRNKLIEKSKIYLFLAIAVLLAILNYRHQQYFKDALTFWEQAARTSPHSAYAVMMYGARVEDKNEGYALMRKAYQLNPNEKYLNYYYGVMLQNQDSLLESEKHFLKEQKISDYFECDFYLAQIYYKKGDKPQAQKHLERYISRDSMNRPANNNLLLLYLETGQKEKASQHITNMQRRGLTVPGSLIQQVQSMN